MKLWITRDLKGNQRIYIWNKKPYWDQISCTYCCDCETCDHSIDICVRVIAVMAPDCPDFTSILKALGLPDEDRPLKRGEMVELNATITKTMGVSLTTKAKGLAKRLKSKKKPSNKELVKFLSAIQDDEPNDEPEEKNDLDW